MPSQNRRTLLVVFIALLVLFETTVYAATTTQRVEQYFQLYVLGPNRIAADYYPNGNSSISQAESVRWYLGVTDFAGSVQFVEIRVKLGNQSLSSPDDLRATPSPSPIVTNLSQFIQQNQTWDLPFVWQISNISSLQGSARISQMQINNETYQLQGLSANNGYNFRLIFELWTWNEDTASFQFGWFAGTEHRVAWLQVWFNATS